MKIPTVLTLFFGLAVIGYSQNKKYELGVESGYSLSSLYGGQFNKTNQTENNIDFKIRITAPVGLTFQYPLSKNIFLRTGIGIECKGNILQKHDSVSEVSNFKYLTLPVLFRASFGKEFRFFVNAGPYFSYLMKHKVDFHRFGYDSTSALVETSVTSVSYPGTLERFDIGIITGAGMGCLIRKKIVLSFEWRNNLGLYNVNKHDPVASYYKPRTIKTFTTSFLIGVAYRFGGNQSEPK